MALCFLEYRVEYRLGSRSVAARRALVAAYNPSIALPRLLSPAAICSAPVLFDVPVLLPGACTLFWASAVDSAGLGARRASASDPLARDEDLVGGRVHLAITTHGSAGPFLCV
ncbi:hypothetical protein ACJZ2D_013444 [Fusarium nematophilum]